MSNVVASPPLFERHVPLGIWKHPVANLIPFANVEVADPVTESPVVCIPPLNVEVPATEFATVIGPENVEVAPLPTIVVVADPPIVS